MNKNVLFLFLVSSVTTLVGMKPGSPDRFLNEVNADATEDIDKKDKRLSLLDEQVRIKRVCPWLATKESAQEPTCMPTGNEIDAALTLSSIGSQRFIPIAPAKRASGKGYCVEEDKQGFIANESDQSTSARTRPYKRELPTDPQKVFLFWLTMYGPYAITTQDRTMPFECSCACCNYRGSKNKVVSHCKNSHAIGTLLKEACYSSNVHI